MFLQDNQSCLRLFLDVETLIFLTVHMVAVLEDHGILQLRDG